MKVVFLLVIVFLIVALIGKKESRYGRVVVGSVFGIFVFSFWHFFLYYADLNHWSELNKQIVFLVTGVAAVVVSIFLTKIKHELPVAISCMASFVVIMVISYSAEAPIKNAIAFQTDYFKSKPAEFTGFSLGDKTSTFKHTAGGYQVFVPEKWELRTDKGPSFQYFQLMDEGEVAIELRPTCFAKETAVITDIVSNLRDRGKTTNNHSKVECFRKNGSFYYCEIYQYSAGKEIKRLNWIGVREDIPKGIDLDFVFFKEKQDALRDVNGIIESLAPYSGTNGNAVCLGLAEWF
jgi:hypothetical protein